MLTNTVNLLSRFFALRRAPTALRTSTHAIFQRRIPLALPLRAFSTGNTIILAPVRKTKARTTKSKAKATTSKSIKPKKKSLSVKSKSPAKAKSKKRTAKPKKAVTAKPSSVRVPLKDRPPRKPVGPFFLYLRRAFTPTGKSMAESQQAVKDAAVTWRSMTEAEKKPFVDESKVLMNDYQLRRERWYKDPKNAAVLRKLNKERKKRGKQRIHAPSNIGVKRPLTPFFRYMQALRETNELSREKAPPGTFWVTWTAREAGARWKALPAAEKDKYTKAYEREYSESA